MAQTYATHTRWYPLYHFFVSPVVGAYALLTILRTVDLPSTERLIAAAWAAALAAGIWASRIMALRVQNRVIRLEMRLRLREVLPPPLAARIGELAVRQLVALRFAGDAELPSLVERTLAGEFATPRDIKRAVRDWQGDYLRV